MPTFSGVDHFSLSVTDLDRSETFYTTILGFMRLMDFGDARALLHRPTGLDRPGSASRRHRRGVQRTQHRP